MPVRETVHVDQRIPATPEMSGNTRFAASSKWTTALVLAVELRFLEVKKTTGLLTQAEFLDDTFISVGIVLFEVVEQATTLADHHEKSAARAVVLLVRFEVLRQLANPFA